MNDLVGQLGQVDLGPMAIIICHEQHNCETTKGVMARLIWSLTFFFGIIVFTVFIVFFFFVYFFF